MSRTYVWSRCPYCNKTLSVTSYRGALPQSKIGMPDFKICPHCQGKISNGKKEWQEMAKIEKIAELLRFIFINIIGTITLAPATGIIVLAIIRSESITTFITISSIAAVIILILLILGEKSIIDESNNRYLNKSKKSKVKY